MREHSGEVLCLLWVWVDVGIDPYELFSGLSDELGDCDRRESPEGAHQCERHFAMASG